jgi:hypothetical protein
MGALKDELDVVIDEAAQSAEKSLEKYSEIAKKTTEQLDGTPPVDAGVLLKLGAQAYMRAATDAATAVTTSMKLFQIAGK